MKKYKIESNKNIPVYMFHGDRYMYVLSVLSFTVYHLSPSHSFAWIIGEGKKKKIQMD